MITNQNNLFLKLICMDESSVGYDMAESKVLQYFCNVRHNLATLDAFAEVMKVINNIRRWDAEVIEYTQGAPTGFISMIWSMTLELVLGFPDLAWLLRFLQPE